MRIRFAAIVFCFLSAQLVMGQAAPSAITNSDVIGMTKAGIGEQTVLLAIQRGPVKFDTSPQALIELKHAGVSDKVLNAILAVPREADSKSKDAQPQSVSGTAPQQPNQQENAPQSMSVGESRDVCAPHTGETSVASTTRTSCCEKGFGSSCSNLAHFYESGTQGLPMDLFIANDFKKKACAMGQQEECFVNISDQSERSAFENAVGISNPVTKQASLQTFLQVYPQSVAKPAVLEMLASIKRQAAIPTPSTTPVSVQRPLQTVSQGLTLRVLQEQSIPYTAESGGGISTSCNIVGTANTSAYATAYGNSAYGNATTNSNQRMTCNSYDTTMRWPHVLNVMFAQASDGNSYIIACDRAWRWSKCNPLRAGEVFSASFTGKGIEVQAINSKGKAESLTYQILQSKAWR